MKKFLIISFALFFFSLTKVNAYAYIYQRQYDRTYNVNDDYVQINETKKIKIVQYGYSITTDSTDGFTIFNPIANDPNQSEKLRKTLDSIKLIDSRGRNINFTQESTKSGNIIIHFNFPVKIYYGQEYSFTLSYNSYGLIVKSGALRDVYIPSFDKNYQFEDSKSKETVTTQVNIPTSYGDVNFALPKTTPQKQGDKWVINFDEAQLVGQNGWIQIGTRQNYSFKIKQHYEPSTNVPLTYNIYKMILPRDIQSGPISQKVYYSKIDPAPYQIEEDKDGNLLATFKIPSNTSGDISIEGYAVLNENNSVNFKNSGNISDIGQSIIDSDTHSAPYWESDASEIKQVAASLKGNETDVYKLLEKTYEYVINKIDYSDVKRFGINERQGALATLKGGAAVCMEYSDLFIALMRAEGIPARAAFGTGYSALDYATSSNNAINHQWAEVYIPKLNSWIGVDPTWGDNGPEFIGGDLNHFYSHVATVDPNTPETAEVQYYGGNYKYSDRDFAVSAIASIPNTKYITEDQLLTSYPVKNSTQKVIDNISEGALLLMTTINQKIDNVLVQNGISLEIGNAIKIGIIGLVIIWMGLGIIRKIKRFRKLTHPNPPSREE